MTFQGRSMDDLPLAAYSTGAEPDERVEPAETLAGAAQPAPPFGLATAGAAAAAAGVAAAMAGGAAPAALPRRLVPPPWLAHPRANLRDPRLLMTGLIGVGIVLLAGSLLLGGGGPGSGGVGPGATPSARPAANATAVPLSGDATVEVSGKVTGTYQLAGASGTGPATGGRVAAAWADALGTGLSLSGPASAGTRTTDATFTLVLTVAVNGVPTTFTSAAGECTVGMAVQPRSVSGSYNCRKLKSADGKLEVEVTGTYRT